MKIGDKVMYHTGARDRVNKLHIGTAGEIEKVFVDSVEHFATVAFVISANYLNLSVIDSHGAVYSALSVPNTPSSDSLSGWWSAYE